MPCIYSYPVSIALGLCLFGGNALAAGLDRYTLDPIHTRVMFAIDHAGFSQAIGTISGSTGTLTFDPERWRDATLEVSVPLRLVDLGDTGWNKAVLAAGLLDADRYPTAEFVATKVEPAGPDRASVHGRLTLRGVTRSIVLNVKLNAAKRHPLPPFRRTIGFSATSTLSRRAFGIDAWPSVIGDTVELRIEAEATRSRAGNDTRAPDSPDDASSSLDSTDPEAKATTTTEPSP